MSNTLRQSPDHKPTGAYYTPPAVARRLADWATRGGTADSVLDPACGDGRFLVGLQGATGVDLDSEAVRVASQALPTARIIGDNFFSWAARTSERVLAVVGNPPFVRYQSFSGSSRQEALEYCDKVGVRLSGLASSWAPFVVAGASLLKPGGRLAFVVPAEISYAVYARPVLSYLLDNFARVGLIAPRDRLFGHLSQDCWLLLADSFGEAARGINLRLQDSIDSPPSAATNTFIARPDLIAEGLRLRPFLLSPSALAEYRRLRGHPTVRTLGDLADLGIGYVTGANDFFHLRPSEALLHRIPNNCLRPAVRTGRDLSDGHIDATRVASWSSQDRPYLLLDIPATDGLPLAVEAYLASEKALEAKTSYKCSLRTPWYRVPDVRVPDAFLSIMCSSGPRLAANHAGATCSNSVHAVTFRKSKDRDVVLSSWHHPLVQLSAEIEGHALGGGMLKLEPSEARRILIPLDPKALDVDFDMLGAAVTELRSWRLDA